MIKSKSSRRGFLALLGTAPIAAPVVAKEAAVAAGLTSLGPSAAMGGMIAASGSYGAPMPQVEWLKESISLFGSDQKKRERKDRADGHARILHPNIASLRSVSPSAAYAINKEHLLAEIERRDWQYLQDEMARWAKSGILS